MSQNLSPFHAELLDFLRRDVRSRVAIGGFDETADPALKVLQQNISSMLASGFVSDSLELSAIVESYQYLFESRGPLHLEKKLLETFSKRETREHQVRIYRGLPRLYRKERPTDSHVKKNFTHLPTLKRLAAEKIVFQLYDGMALSAHAKISFFTWVIHDGWGDYIAALESIEILRRCFTDLQLGWVVLFPKRLGSPPTPKGVKTHLVYYDREVPVSAIHSEALEILRTSDLALQIPTFYPAFDALCEAVSSISFSLAAPPKWISIGEYGFLESRWFHPQTGHRSMGLHFLEKGILIKSTRHSVGASFNEIQNFELLQWLFAKNAPTSIEIESYRSTHHFYLGYLTSPIGGAVYLHALIKAHEKDNKGIDICCPDIGWLIRHIEMQTRSNLPVVEADGVVLQLYYKGKIVPLTEGSNGKKVRILSPSSILPDDFHLLTHLSGEWIAVRGDQSFSEAISANKAFFYDGRDHAKYFLKDLLALAENRIGEYRSTLEILRGMTKAFLHNLPIGDSEWVEESDFQEREPWKEIAIKIGTALQAPDYLTGFQKLNRIIAEEYCFNDFLSHLIQRELVHKDCSIASMEETVLRPFTEGEVSLQTVIEDLKKNLWKMRVIKN